MFSWKWFSLSAQNPSPPSTSDEECHCKEEVEKEEAQALVAALEQSDIQQGRLPFVPGLSKEKDEETLTIHIQDEVSCFNESWTLCDSNILVHYSFKIALGYP